MSPGKIKNATPAVGARYSTKEGQIKKRGESIALLPVSPVESIEGPKWLFDEAEA